MCREFGGVDVLINSNGYPDSAVSFLADENGVETAECVIRTSILGLVSITKKAYQSMVDRDTSGFIINISATQDGQTRRSSSICAASRAAVDTFASELRKELCVLDKPKIRVSNINPTNVRLQDDEGPAFASEDYEGRCIGAKDIADTVMYCLSTPPHVQIKDIQLGAFGGSF